jgi:flagellar motor switch protein FliM
MLSPEEVASLLDSSPAASSKDAPAAAQETIARGSTDAAHATRIGLATRLRAFGEKHARLEAELAVALERRPGDSITVRWLECDSVPFGQLLWTMPPPTCVGVVERELEGRTWPEGTLALHVNLDLLFPLLDRLLQGSGMLAADWRRPLTEVEQRLALRILRPLVAIWERTMNGGSSNAAAWRIEKVLSHPQRLAGWSAETPLVVNRYRVTVENRTGLLQFVAPLRFLDGWLDNAPQSMPSSSRSSHWNVQLADQTLPSADLADLQVGDLLQTDHPLTHPLLAQSEAGEVVPVRVGEVENEKFARRST